VTLKGVNFNPATQKLTVKEDPNDNMWATVKTDAET
jgi:hypothetical protein